MSTRDNLRRARARDRRRKALSYLGLALVAMVFIASTIAFLNGAYCDWPVWTKVGFSSRFWGRCG